MGRPLQERSLPSAHWLLYPEEQLRGSTSRQSCQRESSPEVSEPACTSSSSESSPVGKTRRSASARTSFEPAYLSWTIPTSSRWVRIQDGAAFLEETLLPARGCPQTDRGSREEGSDESLCISPSTTGMQSKLRSPAQGIGEETLPSIMTPLRSTSCQAFKIFTESRSPASHRSEKQRGLEPALSKGGQSSISPLPRRSIPAEDMSWTDDEWGSSPPCWKGESLADLLLQEVSPACQRAPSCESLTHSDIEAALDSMPTPQKAAPAKPAPDQENTCPEGGATGAELRDTPPPRRRFSSLSRSPCHQGRRGVPLEAQVSTPIALRCPRMDNNSFAAARDRFKTSVGAEGRSQEFRSTVLRELNSLGNSPWGHGGVRMV
mmetsp:Transcript_25304/g.58765  ORF Transcript_25304/g.58765 Transcript_25304/m.58765 type:complete len:377 (+) Transcript_25304:52-1182(+)